MRLFDGSAVVIGLYIAEEMDELVDGLAAALEVHGALFSGEFRVVPTQAIYRVLPDNEQPRMSGEPSLERAHIGVRQERLSVSKAYFRHPRLGSLIVRFIPDSYLTGTVIELSFGADALGILPALRTRQNRRDAKRTWRQALNLMTDLCRTLRALYAGMGEEIELPFPHEIMAGRRSKDLHMPYTWWFSNRLALYKQEGGNPGEGEDSYNSKTVRLMHASGGVLAIYWDSQSSPSPGLWRRELDAALANLASALRTRYPAKPS